MYRRYRNCIYYYYYYYIFFSLLLLLLLHSYGRFKVRLDYIKNDASFGQEAVYAQKDFEVAYRQRLTFEVGIATLDQDLVIQTANCCTTPTADHMHAGKFRHELIHEG